MLIFGKHVALLLASSEPRAWKSKLPSDPSPRGYALLLVMTRVLVYSPARGQPEEP